MSPCDNKDFRELWALPLSRGTVEPWQPLRSGFKP